MMKKMLAAATAAAILAGAAASVTTVQAASPAMVCKGWVSGHGDAVQKFKSKLEAQQSWRANVKNTYGASWAKFSNAQVGAFPCNKAQGLWQCNVRAKPCKSRGLSY